MKRYTLYMEGVGDFVKHYDASKPDVVVKRYLNYLRRFTNQRPKVVVVSWEENGETQKAKAIVQWYRGKLKDAVMKSDYQGLWWRLVKIEKLDIA